MGAAPRLADTLDFAHATAEAAGRVILPHFRVAIDVENKDRAGGYDPVTVADRAAETVIRDAIRARMAEPTLSFGFERVSYAAVDDKWRRLDRRLNSSMNRINQIIGMAFAASQ